MILEVFLVLLLLAFSVLGIACLRIAYTRRLYAHIPGPPLDRFVHILRYALLEQKCSIINHKRHPFLGQTTRIYLVAWVFSHICMSNVFIFEEKNEKYFAIVIAFHVTAQTFPMKHDEEVFDGKCKHFIEDRGTVSGTGRSRGERGGESLARNISDGCGPSEGGNIGIL